MPLLMGGGRIVIPSRLRRRLGLKRGDALLLLEVGGNLLVLRKLDLEKLLRELAEEVAQSGLDLEELGRELETEANRLAKKKIHD